MSLKTSIPGISTSSITDGLVFNKLDWITTDEEQILQYDLAVCVCVDRLELMFTFSNEAKTAKLFTMYENIFYDLRL